MSRRLPLCLFALLPALPGCLSLFHEPLAVSPTQWRPADEVSEDAKSRVYVFLFDGYDPFDHGSVTETKDFLHKIGFGKTYTGVPHHRDFFAEEMRRLQAGDPANRFAVVGYRAGAGAAQLLARDAAAAGITLDLLVYLQPSDLDPGLETDLGVRTVTVWGDATVWHPRRATAGEVVDLPKTPGDEVPSHWQTLTMLEHELTAIAFGVPPKPYPPAPVVRLVDPLPPPRNKKPMPKPLPPEWQFLDLNPYGHATGPEFQPEPETLPTPRIMPELPKPKEVPTRPASRYGASRPTE